MKRYRVLSKNDYNNETCFDGKKIDIIRQATVSITVVNKLLRWE
jgi:hypothetical protein